MPEPDNAIAATTHPDPSPFYRHLAAQRPLSLDPSLGLWVAASPETVIAILHHPACTVRPTAEPVPAALHGSPAALVFQHLVRMTDGPDHAPRKQAVSAALATRDPDDAARTSREWARTLSPPPNPESSPDESPNLATDLSVYVLGSLLGIHPDTLPDVTRWVAAFVRCLAPASTPDQLESGKRAAGLLYDTIQSLLAAEHSSHAANLLTALAREARAVGIDDPAVVVANAIGFLSQAYEATTGLIGNTLYALAALPDRDPIRRSGPDLVRETIFDVLRLDPPIHNTRRYLAYDTVITGHDLPAGAIVLVLLAAANHDPIPLPRSALGPPTHPDQSPQPGQQTHPDQSPRSEPPSQPSRYISSFGSGAHACPGQTLATTIARAAVERWLALDPSFTLLPSPAVYRPLSNARIPILPPLRDTSTNVAPTSPPAPEENTQ